VVGLAKVKRSTPNSHKLVFTIMGSHKDYPSPANSYCAQLQKARRGRGIPNGFQVPTPSASQEVKISAVGLRSMIFLGKVHA